MVALLLAGGLPLLGACQPYALRGRVVRGPMSRISLVEAGDPRLQAEGITAANLDLTLDPLSLGRRRLSFQSSDEQGWFALPADVLGAGALQLEVALSARLSGYEPVREVFILPKAGQRILVELAAGQDRNPDPQDTRGELEQYFPKKK